MLTAAGTEFVLVLLVVFAVIVDIYVHDGC